jgi:hypothetical protein
MAISVTFSDAAKEALANRAAGGTDKFEMKYVVFVDAAASPARFVADATSISVNSTNANKNDVVANGTCPTGVTTPIGGQATPSDGSTAYTMALIIGDVGEYTVASKDDADDLVDAGWDTLEDYVIATIVAGVVGDRITVTAGQPVKLTNCQITW